MSAALSTGTVAAAIRDTMDFFMADASQLAGRNLDVDPAPTDDGGIRLSIGGAGYRVTVQRERE